MRKSRNNRRNYIVNHMVCPHTALELHSTCEYYSNSTWPSHVKKFYIFLNSYTCFHNGLINIYNLYGNLSLIISYKTLKNARKCVLFTYASFIYIYMYLKRYMFFPCEYIIIYMLSTSVY